MIGTAEATPGVYGVAPPSLDRTPAQSHETTIFLTDALILFVAVVLTIPLFTRLRLNPIIGFLLAGLLVGPYGFALIQHVDTTHRFAELGIVFLLFAVGLELSFERLQTMAKYVFGLGILQVGVTAVAIAAASSFLGVSAVQAATIGLALAMSSTAIVLQILARQGQLSTRLGRVILSILLLQDLAVVPSLAIIGALVQQATAESLSWTIAFAAAKATGMLLSASCLWPACSCGRCIAR